MEHKSSLPCSQELANEPYPEPVISTHTFIFSFFERHFNSVRLGLPGGLFPSGLRTKTLYEFGISPMHAKFPAHLILLYLITLITFGEAYKS
jgi:hypothetical protein